VDFRWNRWNLDHATQHGVDPEEAQSVVARARAPFPLWRADDKWLVWGRGRGGRLLQVVFVLDGDGTVYVIHARPLTEREKRHYRKRTTP
jgi:uncharacterized DUF497 family protein